MSMSRKINLKNYTSTVSPQRSVGLIEEALLKIGATHIAKSYAEGELLGITFQIVNEHGPIIFKVEARHQAIAELLLSGIKKMHKGTRARLQEQARRTAWKLLLDGIQVKAAEIILERRNPIEVFLPYVYDMQNDQTLFQKLEASKFKMLKSGD